MQQIRSAAASARIARYTCHLHGAAPIPSLPSSSSSPFRLNFVRGSSSIADRLTIGDVRSATFPTPSFVSFCLLMYHWAGGGGS
jgi:hypothetical protein